MRTAILLSGQLRGFKYIIDNLKNNFINYLGEVDTYFYINKDSYNIDDVFTPTEVKYEDDIIHDESGIFNFLGHQFSTPQRFMQQWYSLYMCKEMMLASNKSYDYVVRTRPDNDFVTPLTWDILNPDKINICNWGNHLGGYNDRFAIGPFNEMLTYCDFYHHCKKYPGNSELRLKQYLNENNIPVNFIDHVHYRINEDGSRREHP